MAKSSGEAVTSHLIDASEPLPRPEWVRLTNEEGRLWHDAGMLPEMVPVDEHSLLESARRMTGLDDFGEDDWREPFSVLTRALEEEAELNLVGRLVARSEILSWLKNRLKLTDLVKRHPEILDEQIVRPIIITGLGRTGTSILQELLWQDPNFRTPMFWETYCLGESAQSGGTDAHACRVGSGLTEQMVRVTPELNAMHETAGDIPAEDATVWNYSFLSDHILSYYQIPSYEKYFNQADPRILFRHHKLALQALQWRAPKKQWFGKTLYYLGHLPALFEVYPDARIIHTHRDPLRVSASLVKLLRTLYWQRSDKDFDMPGFDELLVPEQTARRLERVIDQRDSGMIPENQIVDSRFADLMDDPVAAVRKIYTAFEIPFTDDNAERIRHYLANKPRDKHGANVYKKLSPEMVERLRPVFRRYQERYGVPDEV